MSFPVTMNASKKKTKLRNLDESLNYMNYEVKILNNWPFYDQNNRQTLSLLFTPPLRFRFSPRIVSHITPMQMTDSSICHSTPQSLHRSLKINKRASWILRRWRHTTSSWTTQKTEHLVLPAKPTLHPDVNIKTDSLSLAPTKVVRN